MGRAISLTIHAATVSHIGCIRKNNEDNFFFNGDFMLPEEVDSGVCLMHTFEGKAAHVFAVCDGMGGQNAGERASLVAAQSFCSLPLSDTKPDRVQSVLENHVQQLSGAIWKDGIDRKTPGQGTTLALLSLKDLH